MVAVAESDPTVGIVGACRLRGNRVFGDGLPYTRTVITGRDICRLELIDSLTFFGSVTTILCRSEIIRSTSPFFDESTVHEDTDACYRTLSTWNFGFVHQILTFTRLHNDSITGRILDFTPHVLDRLLQLSKFGPMYLERDEFTRRLQKVKSDYYNFLARRLLSGQRGAFWQYHISGLRTGGLRLEKLRLLKHVCLRLLQLLANPGETLTRLYERLQAHPE